METRIFSQDVGLLYENMLQQCASLDEHERLFKNLESGIIEGIKNTIYLEDRCTLSSDIITPYQLICLSKYINLDKILSVGDTLEYNKDNIRIELLIKRFLNNKPVFTISNIGELFIKSDAYAQIDMASRLRDDIIKTDLNLYRLITLNYELDDTKEIPMPTLKSKLSDNSWEDIIWASEHDYIPDTWKVGDEIDLTLSGKYNETVTLQIWDFNHYDKCNGSGKARILFGMKHLMKTEEQMNDYSRISWNDSYMKNVVMKNIYESIPEYIRNNIKEVNTYANNGDKSCDISEGLLSTDKVFIPGTSEIDNDFKEQNQTEQGQSLISIFKDEKNRIKTIDTVGEFWWTRSRFYLNPNKSNAIHPKGEIYACENNELFGVCFCFNI